MTDISEPGITGVEKRFAVLPQESILNNNIETLIMQASEAEAVKLFADTYLSLRGSCFNETDTYAEIEETTKNPI